jgi:hypothetical protein
LNERILRVVHPTPGFFLTDARLTVCLDGYAIYDGSFRSGFDVGGPISPGPHLLTTRLDVDLFSRSREYRFDIAADATSPATWVATLDYSRLWGNFARKLALMRV